MGNLLSKANGILSEKEEKIIPGNIKAGVTIFDVVGTYEGSGGGTTKPLMFLDGATKGFFDGKAFADLLDTRLTSEQKGYEVYKDGSAHVPTVLLTCGFGNVREGTENQFSLSFGNGVDGLYLNLIHGNTVQEVFEVDHDNCQTSEYYKSVMTIGDLIALLRAIGAVSINASISGYCYLYDIISVRINLLTEQDSSLFIFLENVTNNFFKVAKTGQIVYDLNTAPVITLHCGTIANIIDANATAEEKQTTINVPSTSGFLDCIITLSSNVHILYSEESYGNGVLYLAWDGTNSFQLCLATDENLASSTRLNLFSIWTEDSEHEMPNPLTLGGLINILRQAGDVTKEISNIPDLESFNVPSPMDSFSMVQMTSSICFGYDNILEVSSGD